MINVIKNVSTLIQQSQIEKIRALFGAGCYEHATTYKRFAVDSTRWHSWPEKHHTSQVVVFQNFRPDMLENPKTAGRKPLLRIKQKALASEIIEDCLEPSSKRQAHDDEKKTNLNSQSQARESVHSGKPLSSTQLCSQKSICFADPREKVQKVFELYLQKNVHRSV